MKIPKNTQVKAFGQITSITDVITVHRRSLVYISPPIVVPSRIYTRDYLDPTEIQEILNPRFKPRMYNGIARVFRDGLVEVEGLFGVWASSRRAAKREIRRAAKAKYGLLKKERLTIFLTNKSKTWK